MVRTLPSNLIYKVSSLLSITFQEDVGSGILTNSSRIPKYLRTGFHLSPNRLALRQHCNPENASTPSLLVAHPWMILGVCRGCCRIHSTASVPSRASRTGDHRECGASLSGDDLRGAANRSVSHTGTTDCVSIRQALTIIAASNKNNCWLSSHSSTPYRAEA